MPKAEHHILTADIGGTNSRFAHFTTDENERLDLVSLLWLKSAAAGSFADLLKNLCTMDGWITPDSRGMRTGSTWKRAAMPLSSWTMTGR